jgi:CRP/FNR family transcriptional regulator
MSASEDRLDLVEQLASVPYFEGLSEGLLVEIASAMTERVYESDEVVFFEGESGQSLRVIKEGYLKAIKYSLEGREQILQMLGPGEVFGAIAVFCSDKSPATVIALEQTILYSIDQETMRRLLADYTELASRVIENLASRVLSLVKLVEDLSLRTVEGRLAHLLVEQSQEGVVRRRQWTTQAEMAARLGTVPDVLNRALRKFVEEGLIDLERHQIKIQDLDRLKARAMIES